MTEIPFGLGATLFVGGYLVFVLALGYLAKRQRVSDSLGEFYLAGRSLGGFVLFLTLYATQYSGNALLGYPGEAYRLGFAWLMSVGFMMAIVVIYLIFAPRLYQISRRYHYITPGDYIKHRFGSPPLTLLSNLLFIAVMVNYLLAQLMAMGHVVAGLSANLMPYWMGVVILTLVIIIYETMGGMRAVAWTDCIQGLMLLVGLVGLLVAVVPGPERLEVTTRWLLEHQPEKIMVPSWEMSRTWLSTVLLVGVSASVYPQAIQRIYAARSVGALKRSLSLMAFMPLVTMLAMLLVGILAIPQFAALEGIEADQVMPRLLREWAEQSYWLYAMAVLVITGILAAIMSTADSALLTLSSILTKDILGTTLLRNLDEVRLTQVGKVLSWLTMVAVALVALVPRITLWGLTELKMDILAQLSPLFLLGLTWRKFTAGPALLGIVAGMGLAMGLTLNGYGRVWGIHAGVLGMGINYLLCVTATFLRSSRESSTRR
jgi:SSS family solute:Na+ symporter